MEYIEAPRYPAALKRPFTELPALGDDRTALIVHRSPLSYLILNRFPYNPGHLLAVPFREVNDLLDLTPPERADLMEEIVFGQKLLHAVLKPDGINVGFNLGSAAGGSIAISTVTSCPAGRATTTSCRFWAKPASCPKPSKRCGTASPRLSPPFCNLSLPLNLSLPA